MRELYSTPTLTRLIPCIMYTDKHNPQPHISRIYRKHGRLADVDMAEWVEWLMSARLEMAEWVEWLMSARLEMAEWVEWLMSARHVEQSVGARNIYSTQTQLILFTVIWHLTYGKGPLR